MVQYPDDYLFRRRLIATLRPSLQKEVLRRGITAEFSTMQDILEKAKDIKDSLHYDIRSWMSLEVMHSNAYVDNAMAESSKQMIGAVPKGTAGQTIMNRQSSKPIWNTSSNTDKIPETSGKQPSKYNKNESKEYFDIVNIDYYDAILGMEFLRKHKVVIDFMNNCPKIKDKVICNQANEYKVGEGNPQRNKKNVSMKALKQEELKISWENSNWLSKKSHPKRNDEKDSATCLTQKSVGLKKELSEYTCSDIPQLCEEIAERYSNWLGPLPLKLPPISEVSHEILLIDESKQLKHRLPKCPEVFCSELTQKVKWYTTAGWWVPVAAKQAMPMLCIPKKNDMPCTVFDLQQQNENTCKDVTPFPNQDAIPHDIAQGNFRSKLDMTEAYEQMHIRPEDVCKTTSSTIFGTFQSWVMQMGDCNAPSTFQQLMTTIFWEFLRRFVHIYLNDIFIYSQSIREHIEHIMKVLQWLKESQFYYQSQNLTYFQTRQIVWDMSLTTMAYMLN